METIYKASLDTTAKIITGLVFLIIAFVIVTGDWKGDYVIVVIPVVFIIVYLFKVQSYQVTDEKLIIKRPFSLLNKKILLSEIESVHIPNKEDFKWTVRTMGNGGFFGYTGHFYNKKIGKFSMYATNKTSMLLIILQNNKGKIVISPDDLGMADDLQKRLKSPM